jgi:hypothetical protein
VLLVTGYIRKEIKQQSNNSLFSKSVGLNYFVADAIIIKTKPYLIVFKPYHFWSTLSVQLFGFVGVLRYIPPPRFGDASMPGLSTPYLQGIQFKAAY